jgi:predicted DNA-binding ribbon-helix-helix protein
MNSWAKPRELPLRLLPVEVRLISQSFDASPVSSLGVHSKEGVMKSPIVKRSIVIAGHKTSVSLEDAFWKGLKEIARARGLTLSELVEAIDSERTQGNLSSALRLLVLDHYHSQVRAQASTKSTRGQRQSAA